MSSTIAILNKSGVAMASDSTAAVSRLGNRQIYHSGNKLFALSKFHPVGVMMYQPGTFMGIPWEVLISAYSRELGSQAFPELKGYQEDFIHYLKSNIFRIDPQTQQQHLTAFFMHAFERLIKLLINYAPQNNKEAIHLHNIADNMEGLYRQLRQNSPLLPDFAGYSCEEFMASQSPLLDKISESFFEDVPLSETNRAFFYKSLYYYVMSPEFEPEWTGLAFVGYGDTDLYPSCIPLKLSGVIDRRIRYYVEQDKLCQISDRNKAVIRPFAQTNLMDMLLPDMDADPDQIYADTLSLLPKRDMAKIAESLVYLAYLKKKISCAEGYVSSPVDVALISRAEGFVWIKKR